MLPGQKGVKVEEENPQMLRSVTEGDDDSHSVPGLAIELLVVPTLSKVNKDITLHVTNARDLLGVCDDIDGTCKV